MSDADLGKKLAEEAYLLPFLDEYKAVTGVDLQLDRSGERPDFICLRRGKPTGIELVRVVQNPTLRLHREDQMDGLEAATRVQDVVYAKEAKRLSAGWSYPDRTILVVQLMDATLLDMALFLNEDRMKEVSTTGFLEVWVADYTLLEAFRTVQLFGVKPRRWRGVHPHRFRDRKPYG